MNKTKELVKLKKKAYKLWTLKVREIGVCELCGKKYKELNEKGKPTILQAHHIMDRYFYHRLSWDLQNGICLCSICHKFSAKSAHRGSIKFSEWFRNKYPEKYKYLLQVCDEPFEITIENMTKTIEDLSLHLVKSVDK